MLGSDQGQFLIDTDSGEAVQLWFGLDLDHGEDGFDRVAQVCTRRGDLLVSDLSTRP